MIRNNHKFKNYQKPQNLSQGPPPKLNLKQIKILLIKVFSKKNQSSKKNH